MWSSGDVIVRRDRWQGRTWHASAMFVVEDNREQLVTYSPPGSDVARATSTGTELVGQLAEGTWQLEPTTRFNHTLAVHRTGDSYSVCLFWDETWGFLGWYINLEAPHRRSANRVDTCDHHLDIVVAPDRTSWAWKDEDHLSAAEHLGLYSEIQCQGLRRQGERAVVLLCGPDNPWEQWLTWRPRSSWSDRAPELPPGWDDAPTAKAGFTVRKREPCPFCNNIAGVVSRLAGAASVVFEDELTYSFVNPAPLGGVVGHTLVIPRRHVETVFDLSEEEEAALGRTVGRVARAVRTSLDPDGLLIVQRNGVAAEQDVPHVHFHVIPRDADVPYPPTQWVDRTPISTRDEVATRLRSVIMSS